MSEVESKVKQIIAEHLGKDISEVESQKRFAEDLGADSLDLVEMIMAFEEKFGIEIPEDDSTKIATVGDAVTYIANKAN